MRSSFLAGLCLALSCWSSYAAAQGPAGPQAVQGLIVQLKPAAASGRESPQAARERVLEAARQAGVSAPAERALGERHRLLKLAAPVQGEALEAALRRLRLHPEVAWVEPDVRLPLAAVPNDPGFANQWHLQPATAAAAAAIGMPAAWDISTGASGAAVTVAVIDTGVRYSHPDLAGRLLPGYDFISEVDFSNDGNGRDADASDPGDSVTSADRQRQPGLFATCELQGSTWHGTFIAGQIAAVANNGIGVAGIHWGARILPVRVSGKCGALLSDLLDGVRWAAGVEVPGVPRNTTPARVINLSFGGDQPCTPSYQSAMDDATAAGAVVVVAAGNNSGELRRPADCRGVLAVGGVQENGLKAGYSDAGANVALMAPGGTAALPLFSTSNSGLQEPGADSYGTKFGTSFSAPLASGVAALMLSVNPSLAPADLIARMRAATRPHVVLANAPACAAGVTAPCNCTTSLCGSGLLDARLALLAAAPGSQPVASIRPVAEIAAGSVLTLDGRSSAASAGQSITAYRWRQVSGAAVSLIDAATAVATAQLPAAAGTFVFELTVTDGSGASDAEQVQVVSVASSGNGGAGGGGGGGAAGWPWVLALWCAVAWVAWAGRRRRG